jgi:transcriptional regulator with XRE-family HTH domain
LPGKDLDHTLSPAAFFGNELRLRREALGWSQKDLGQKVNLSPSRVAQIETAAIPPTRHNATAFDVALSTGGLFDRLIDLMDSAPTFPDWVQSYVQLEAVAVSISGYAPMVVPGLLQTEDYARAVLRAGRPRDGAQEVEARVQARIGRQELLRRDRPPALWFVLEEELLKRAVGGRDVMGKQLEHLAHLAETPAIVIQMMRTDVGAHAALGGALNLLSLADRPNVAYVEGPFTGQLFEDPSQVTECGVAYSLLQATARSREESAAMIRTAMEDMQQ